MASTAAVTAPAAGAEDANNKRFNAEAAAWDSDPFINEMSAEAWKAIQKHAPLLGTAAAEKGDKPTVLEIGCGTGTLSLHTATAASLVVAVDAAEGMVDVLRSKLERPGAPDNIVPICALLEDAEDGRLPPATASQPDGPRIKFDLVTSHLVLHHIPSLEPLLRTMFACLKGGGMVALTDFEDFGPDARLFHPEAKLEGVERHGIPRAWMAELMRAAGFEDVRVEVAWEALKAVETFPGEFGQPGPPRGRDMTFPFLICLGRKP